MLTFLLSFSIFMICYQIIHTVGVYGWMDGAYHQFFSISKDIVWIMGSIIIYAGLWHKFRHFIGDFKHILIILGAVICRSIGLSYHHNVSLELVVIGSKYVLYPFVVMVMAIGLGYCMSRIQMHQYLYAINIIITGALGLGFLRFGAKLALPDLMMSLGYGPVGDFVVGLNPPLYYRTGPGGRARYSGLMAGPNNLSYLLIGLGPLLALLWQGSQYYTTRMIGFALSLLGSFSRSAWIACIGQILYIYRRRISTISVSKYLIAILVLVIGIGVLLLWKPQSTLGHASKTWQAFQIWTMQPLGYGLGYSGPSALHHGSIIPENTYLQWLIDIGWPGALGLLLIILLIARIIYQLPYHPYQKYLYARGLGILGLALQGLFLHVLEDSTVNYLVLTIGGILLGHIMYEYYHQSDSHTTKHK